MQMGPFTDIAEQLPVMAREHDGRLSYSERFGQLVDQGDR